MYFFLKKYNDAYGKKIFGLTRRAQTAMLQHPWPGNVRELENVISSACITATEEFIAGQVRRSRRTKTQGIRRNGLRLRYAEKAPQLGPKTTPQSTSQNPL